MAKNNRLRIQVPAPCDYNAELARESNSIKVPAYDGGRRKKDEISQDEK